jgi:peroxin-1
VLIRLATALCDVVHGLLVTGRTGAGKTEVLKAVARGLQVDPSIYACASFAPLACSRFCADAPTRAVSRYVDLARYRDKPVRVLRELLAFWRDKAAWHAPSVLALDNLDAIVPAEVEVRDALSLRPFFS